MNYKTKLYLYFLVALVVYATFNVVLQMNKEKRYQTNVQRSELNAYCDATAEYLQMTHDTLTTVKILPPDYRITLIDKDGKVLFDNVIKDVSKVEDHIGRPEINSARQNGNGYAVRKSHSTGKDYLYFAKRFPDGSYIRVAMPYVLKLSKTFHTDSVLLYISIALLFLILLWILYQSDKFSTVMQTLKKFAADAESGHVDYNTVKFPDTDSGEIGARIISLYKQLEDSKKQTYLEKDKTRQMKQELTNNIAHELKTPVSSIRGYLETILTADGLTEEKRKQFTEKAYSQSIRLTELIDDVTMLNKMENAESLFEREKVVLYEVAEEVHEEMAESMRLKNIRWENLLNKEDAVPGNYSLIHAIFRNLVENSVKYAGDNITLHVEGLKETDGFFHVTYYDTGRGVDEQDLTRIFDRFVRLDDGRTRKDGGSGLGLAIVKHAVLLHLGTISASNRLKGGLQFDFTLN